MEGQRGTTFHYRGHICNKGCKSKESYVWRCCENKVGSCSAKCVTKSVTDVRVLRAESHDGHDREDTRCEHLHVNAEVATRYKDTYTGVGRKGRGVVSVLLAERGLAGLALRSCR